MNYVISVSLYKNPSPLLSTNVLALIVLADRTLKPLILLVPSTITAFPAETVPATTPSIVSNSLSDMFALPITNELLAVTLPELVMLPEFIVPKPETFPFVSNV